MADVGDTIEVNVLVVIDDGSGKDDVSMLSDNTNQITRK